MTAWTEIFEDGTDFWLSFSSTKRYFILLSVKRKEFKMLCTLTTPFSCPLPSELSYWKSRFPLIKPISFALSVEQDKSFVNLPAAALRYRLPPASPPYFLATSPLLTCIFSWFFKVKASWCYTSKWVLCRGFVSSVATINPSRISFQHMAIFFSSEPVVIELSKPS